jgi:hypothetical protein
MLATQPGPDLAITLASERRGLQHPADQLDHSASLIEVAGPGRPQPLARARRA